MKSFSKILGVLAAVSLLGTVIGCNSEVSVAVESPKLQNVDFETTDNAVIFSWDYLPGSTVQISRQEPDGAEVYIGSVSAGYTYTSNGQSITSGNSFIDRVTNRNVLKAGVEYTYRLYNIDSGAVTPRAAGNVPVSYSKTYSYVERKVTLEKVAEKGSKLQAYDKEDVVIEEDEEVIKEDGVDKKIVRIYVKEGKEDKTAQTYIKVESDSDFEFYCDGRKANSREAKDGAETTTAYFKYKPYDDNGVKVFNVSVYKGWEDDYYGTSDAVEATIGDTPIEKFTGNYARITEDMIGKDLILSWTGDVSKMSTTKYSFVFCEIDNKGNKSAAKEIKNGDVVFTKTTSDNNDHFSAVIKQSAFFAEPKKDNDGNYIPVSMRGFAVTVVGDDADGTHFCSNWEVNISPELTTYTYLDSLTAECDNDGIVTVTIDGANYKGVDLYYKGDDGVIKKVEGAPFKESSEYKFDDKKKLPTGTYTFYANVASEDNLYNGDSGRALKREKEVTAYCIIPPKKITLEKNDYDYYNYNYKGTIINFKNIIDDYESLSKGGYIWGYNLYDKNGNPISMDCDQNINFTDDSAEIKIVVYNNDDISAENLPATGYIRGTLNLSDNRGNQVANSNFNIDIEIPAASN